VRVETRVYAKGNRRGGLSSGKAKPEVVVGPVRPRVQCGGPALKAIVLSERQPEAL